ncbi:hypothetical protein ABPG72_009314 [Tetrahymena utriculariae]
MQMLLQIYTNSSKDINLSKDYKKFDEMIKQLILAKEENHLKNHLSQILKYNFSSSWCLIQQQMREQISLNGEISRYDQNMSQKSVHNNSEQQKALTKSQFQQSLHSSRKQNTEKREISQFQQNINNSQVLDGLSQSELDSANASIINQILLDIYHLLLEEKTEVCDTHINMLCFILHVVKNYQLFWMRLNQIFKLELSLKNLLILKTLEQECDRQTRIQLKKQHQKYIFYAGYLDIIYYDNLLTETSLVFQQATQQKLLILDQMKRKNINLSDLSEKIQNFLSVRSKILQNIKIATKINPSSRELDQICADYCYILSFSSYNLKKNKLSSNMEEGIQVNQMQQDKYTNYLDPNQEKFSSNAYVSSNFLKIFNFKKKEDVMNQPLEIILPSIFTKYHSLFIKNCFSKDIYNDFEANIQQIEENKREKQIESTCVQYAQNQKSRMVFAVSQNNHLIAVKLDVKVNRISINNEFGLTAHIQQVNKYNDYIQFRPDNFQVICMAKLLHSKVFKVFTRFRKIKLRKYFAFLKDQQNQFQSSQLNSFKDLTLEEYKERIKDQQKKLLVIQEKKKQYYKNEFKYILVVKRNKQKDSIFKFKMCLKDFPVQNPCFENQELQYIEITSIKRVNPRTNQRSILETICVESSSYQQEAFKQIIMIFSQSITGQNLQITSEQADSTQFSQENQILAQQNSKNNNNNSNKLPQSEDLNENMMNISSINDVAFMKVLKENMNQSVKIEQITPQDTQTNYNKQWHDQQNNLDMKNSNKNCKVFQTKSTFMDYPSTDFTKHFPIKRYYSNLTNEKQNNEIQEMSDIYEDEDDVTKCKAYKTYSDKTTRKNNFTDKQRKELLETSSAYSKVSSIEQIKKQFRKTILTKKSHYYLSIVNGICLLSIIVIFIVNFQQFFQTKDTIRSVKEDFTIVQRPMDYNNQSYGVIEALNLKRLTSHSKTNLEYTNGSKKELQGRIKCKMDDCFGTDITGEESRKEDILDCKLGYCLIQFQNYIFRYVFIVSQEYEYEDLSTYQSYSEKIFLLNQRDISLTLRSIFIQSIDFNKQSLEDIKSSLDNLVIIITIISAFCISLVIPLYALIQTYREKILSLLTKFSIDILDDLTDLINQYYILNLYRSSSSFKIQQKTDVKSKQIEVKKQNLSCYSKLPKFNKKLLFFSILILTLIVLYPVLNRQLTRQYIEESQQNLSILQKEEFIILKQNMGKESTIINFPSLQFEIFVDHIDQLAVSSNNFKISHYSTIESQKKQNGLSPKDKKFKLSQTVGKAIITEGKFKGLYQLKQTKCPKEEKKDSHSLTLDLTCQYKNLIVSQLLFFLLLVVFRNILYKQYGF